MIRFEYDPQLVEQATFLAARRDVKKECALHVALDRLYSIDDIELRHRFFCESHAELFRRFGLDQIVPAYIGTFRLINERLGRCIIREAERARAQSVDLYREKSLVAAERGGQVMIIALCPDSLLDGKRLGPWLYRQLQHVEDMLDERFSYEDKLPEAPAPQQNVLRDRYAAIWDIYVESRLLRSRKVVDHDCHTLWHAFCKAFSCDAVATARSAFEKLMGTDSLAHPQILAWATEPSRLLEGEGVENENQVCAMA
jgi:hypothetical protein